MAAARGTMNVQRRWQWRGPISLSKATDAVVDSPLRVGKRRSAKRRALLLLIAINALALSDYLLDAGLIFSPETVRRLESTQDKRQFHRELCSEGSAVVTQQLDMVSTWGQWISRMLRRLSPFHGDDGEERRRLASGCNFTDYIYTQEVQVVAPPTPPPSAAPSISPTPKPVGFFEGLFGSTGGTAAPSPQPTPLPGHPTKAPIATDAPTDASFPTNPQLPPGTPSTPNSSPVPEEQVPAPTEPAQTNTIVAVEPIGLPDPPNEPYTEDPNGPANPEPPTYDIAYALTIPECPADPQTGPATASINALSFYDSFSLLRHGVCNCTKSNQVMNPETGLLEPLSDYDSTMYALVHCQAVTCQAADGTWYDLVASLQGMGYFVKIFDEPVYADEIVGSQYLKENIEADVGIRDLLRVSRLVLF